jgi:hypothetical protein
MRGKCNGAKRNTEATDAAAMQRGRGAFCTGLKHDRQGRVDCTEEIMPALVTTSKVRILAAESPRVPGPGVSTRG